MYIMRIITVCLLLVYATGNGIRNNYFSDNMLHEWFIISIQTISICNTGESILYLCGM